VGSCIYEGKDVLAIVDGRRMMVGWIDPGVNQRNFSATTDSLAPRYTASLDAAMTLVPTKPFPDLRPGEWWWSVDSLGCDAHVAYENHDSGIVPNVGSDADAATPALALVAACLRARYTMEEDNG
jgi:hypothetical protein